MNEAVIAFVGGSLLVGCVAAGVMLFAQSQGRHLSESARGLVVLGVIVIIVGMMATTFLSGWYGGTGD